MIIQSPFSLSDKTVIITGASSGIGRQTAVLCSLMGARVVIIGRNKDRVHSTFSELSGRGHAYFLFDLTDSINLPLLIKDIYDEVGSFNGLVNCAGISGSFSLNAISEQRMDSFFSTNVFAAVGLTREVVKRKYFNSSGGSIIFISSVMGVVGAKGKTLYSMTKGSLIAGVRSLAADFAARHIRVNCISPGTIVTPLNAHLPHIADPNLRNQLESQHPLGFGTTDDIATGVVYLLSEASKWITGQNLIIDGGYSIV